MMKETVSEDSLNASTGEGQQIPLSLRTFLSTPA